MAGMLLRHKVFQVFLSFITSAVVKEKGRVAEANLKWEVLWVVSVCSVKPRCVLCTTQVQSEWNWFSEIEICALLGYFAAYSGNSLPELSC